MTTPPSTPPVMSLEEACARAAHEVNNVYNRAIGDTLSPAFDDLTEGQKGAAVEGARHTLAGGSEEDSHRKWMEALLAEGWTLGPVKDPELKTHPNLVPYTELPNAQRIKDTLFQATVRSTAAAVTAARGG